jgi:hypothetical protein
LRIHAAIHPHAFGKKKAKKNKSMLSECRAMYHSGIPSLSNDHLNFQNKNAK